jgi:hypothetical protein
MTPFLRLIAWYVPAGQMGGIEPLRNDGFKIDPEGGSKVTDS